MIACSPLTGRIFSGRTNSSGLVFVGTKKDVTSEVLGAIIGKAEYHGGDFVVDANGQPAYRIYVTKLTAEAAPAPASESPSFKIGGG